MDKTLGNCKNNLLTIFEGLIIFDVWLLIKARRLLNLVISLMSRILKIVLFVLIIIGLVLMYSYITQTTFHIINSKDPIDKINNPKVNQFSKTYDNSQLNLINLKKQLIRIKIETMYIEKSLYKMNLQLKNLYDYRQNLGEQVQNNYINLADFASEAIGGMVIATPNTRTYNIPKSVQITLFGIPIWKPNYFTPRKVIQPWSQAGECWAFRGSQGKIEIELAHTAIIERVTLEHISSSASLTGKITSAPKIFNVLGKIKTDFVKIDAFVYKDTGLPSQTFEIKESKMKNTPFKRIMLEILSNWGNTNYTCIYRFKVHGKIYHKPNKKESHTIVQ